ncbi:MAG TPA: SCO family protein [Bryobacteraceae bacterium]|nr:SCO family protein [Bryobacteraceae bacterium]
MKSRFLGLFFILASLAPAQQGRSDTYRGGIVTPPLPKPRFVLTDTSGAPFDFWNRTQGSVTLLFFGYTNCPDQCPMHMSNIGVALKKLPPGLADQVKLVFVTTDPARDTRVELRRWLDNFDKHFVGLTGPKLLSRRSRGPRAFPRPVKQNPAMAAIQLRTPTLLSRIRKTIWPMLSILAA